MEDIHAFTFACFGKLPHLINSVRFDGKSDDRPVGWPVDRSASVLCLLRIDQNDHNNECLSIA